MSSVTWRMPASRRSIRSSIAFRLLAELVELVAGAADLDPAAEVAGHDPGGGPVDPLEPAQHPAAHHVAADQPRTSISPMPIATEMRMMRSVLQTVLDVAADQEQVAAVDGDQLGHGVVQLLAGLGGLLDRDLEADELVGSRPAPDRASRSDCRPGAGPSGSTSEVDARAGSARPPRARRRPRCRASMPPDAGTGRAATPPPPRSPRAIWSSMNRALSDVDHRQDRRRRQAEQAEIGQRQPEGGGV